MGKCRDAASAPVRPHRHSAFVNPHPVAACAVWKPSLVLNCSSGRTAEHPPHWRDRWSRWGSTQAVIGKPHPKITTTFQLFRVNKRHRGPRVGILLPLTRAIRPVQVVPCQGELGRMGAVAWAGQDPLLPHNLPRLWRGATSMPKARASAR